MDLYQHKLSLVPKEGYNVIAIDDFEIPSESAYLYAHFEETPEGKLSAETTVVKLNAQGIKAYVYDKNTI